MKWLAQCLSQDLSPEPVCLISLHYCCLSCWENRGGRHVRLCEKSDRAGGGGPEREKSSSGLSGEQWGLAPQAENRVCLELSEPAARWLELRLWHGAGVDPRGLRGPPPRKGWIFIKCRQSGGTQYFQQENEMIVSGL